MKKMISRVTWEAADRNHFAYEQSDGRYIPRVAQRAAKGKEIGFTGPFNPLAWRLSGEKHCFRKRR